MGTAASGAGSGSSSKPKETVVRHNPQTGRWLTAFRAMWDPKCNDSFIVGAMGQPRSMNIFHSGGERAVNVRHELLTTVASCCAFHPTLDMYGGGNASGKCYIFRR